MKCARPHWRILNCCLLEPSPKHRLTVASTSALNPTSAPRSQAKPSPVSSARPTRINSNSHPLRQDEVRARGARPRSSYLAQLRHPPPIPASLPLTAPANRHDLIPGSLPGGQIPSRMHATTSPSP